MIMIMMLMFEHPKSRDLVRFRERSGFHSLVTLVP